MKHSIHFASYETFQIWKIVMMCNVLRQKLKCYCLFDDRADCHFRVLQRQWSEQGGFELEVSLSPAMASPATITKGLDLNETQLAALEELKTKIREEQEELNLGSDDRIYIRNLYSTNFHVQRAYERIVQWYTLKKNNPPWFASKALNTFEKLLDKKIHAMLDTRDAKDRRVYVIKLGNIVVSEQHAYELSNIDDLWLEAVLDERPTQANGCVFILDLKGIPYSIMKYLTPSNCRIGARKAELVPLRVMEYHLVNGGFLLNAIVGLVFPFLSEESKKNIHFHSSSNNFSSLHNFVNPEALPPEYGGTLDQIDYLKCRKLLQERETQILEGFGFGYKSEDKGSKEIEEK